MKLKWLALAIFCIANTYLAGCIMSTVATLSVSSVSPSSSPLVGGKQITLTGTNFLPTTTVKIDGVPCTNIQVHSVTTLTCDSPSHIAGTVPVVVQNGDFSSTYGSFLYRLEYPDDPYTNSEFIVGRANTGAPGDLGFADGGLLAATFNYIGGLAASSFSNSIWYLIDSGNSTVRKIDFDGGTVSTIAGDQGVFSYLDGTGTAAQFNYPYESVQVDDYLVVADISNHCLRKVDLNNNDVTTLAGLCGTSGAVDGAPGVARFTNPDGLYVVGRDVYIGECGTAIRKFNLDTLITTTVAGDGSITGTTDGVGINARFDCPSDFTLTEENGVQVFYISDYNNNTIRRMSLADYSVTTVAGQAGVFGATDAVGTNATFGWPWGITTDGVALYVSDNGSGTIRKVLLSDYTVSTFILNDPTDQVGTLSNTRIRETYSNIYFDTLRGLIIPTSTGIIRIY